MQMIVIVLGEYIATSIDGLRRVQLEIPFLMLNVLTKKSKLLSKTV